MTESVDEYLKRGGKINKIQTPNSEKSFRSDYSHKDKIDVCTTSRYGASHMFKRFAEGFLVKGNNNWKFQK